MARLLALLALLLPASMGLAQDAADLQAGFARPPGAAKAWCYWWWLNGAASKEGITRDMEAMRDKGIAGALLFDAGLAGPDAPRGPAFMSDPWRELYRHALAEADRCGIVLTVNLCSGWNAGGPWVGPEHAAKKLTASALTVEGPGRKSIALPRPPAVQNVYCDVAVLACPLPDGAARAACRLTASSSYKDYRPPLAQDLADDTRWISNGDKPGMGPTPEKSEHLQFEYAQPFAAAALFIQPYSDCGPKDVEVRASDDGKTWRTLHRATLANNKAATLAFKPTTARFFRAVFLTAHPYRGPQSWNVQVAEIDLLTAEEMKKGRPSRRWDHARVVDLTDRLDEAGKLNWDVPAGAWKVVRLGWTLHGTQTQCVGSGPAGPEIDIMSAEAMDAHWAATGAKLVADAGQLAGKTFQYVHIDSYELGQPTWTPKMREEFRRRRGYDPLPCLPAVVGNAMADREIESRFLADYRRTAADLTAERYYGRLRELAVAAGLRGTHPESGGPFFKHWIDGLQCVGINDIPMGEFWKRNSEPAGPISWTMDRNPSLKQAASTAHVYGKADCQAEAYTSFACDWTADPWNMKDIGDEALCHGLTRNVLCFWVHQPRLDARPGFQWAHVGTHFDPNLTWWPLSDGWLTYLARCQHLLRSGRFVADFAWFHGEQIPGFVPGRGRLSPALPPGYDYDSLNAEVLLTLASAKDGRLTLKSGMSYRYLVLPGQAGWSVSPAVLRKIGELVRDGLTVVGPRPGQAPGLGNYPQCDDEVRELADAMWGTRPAESGERKLGQGRVFWGKPLEELTKTDSLPPDLELREVSAGARLDWIHRHVGDADVYFVCNLSAAPASAEAVFRVAGRQPELWDAVTGHVRDLPRFACDAGRTTVPLQFAPRQSWFVVFRRPAAGASGEDKTENFPKSVAVGEITGAWEVSFDPKWGGPARVAFDKLTDWTKRPEDGIRHYSGLAVYRKRIDLPVVEKSERLLLDLGEVRHLARVRLNGRDCGVVWTAPWQADLTTAAKAGANELEIEVANLWPNRLIGDAALPSDKRLTVTNVRTYDTLSHGYYGCAICAARKKSGKGRDLFPSGLLGPVTLRKEE